MIFIMIDRIAWNQLRPPPLTHTGSSGVIPLLMLAEPHRRRALALDKYRRKRKNLKFSKTIRYESRKQLAQTRPRVKGQFVKAAAEDGAGGVAVTTMTAADDDEEDDEDDDDDEEDEEEDNEVAERDEEAQAGRYDGQNFDVSIIISDSIDEALFCSCP